MWPPLHPNRLPPVLVPPAMPGAAKARWQRRATGDRDRPSILLASAGADVELRADLAELLAHSRHACLGVRNTRGCPSTILRMVPLPRRGRIGGEERIAVLVLPGRELPHVLRDLHRAEFGSAHAAEMRHLRAFRRQGLV